MFSPRLVPRQKQEVLMQGTVPGHRPALSFGQSTALCFAFQTQVHGASNMRLLIPEHRGHFLCFLQQRGDEGALGRQR